VRRRAGVSVNRLLYRFVNRLCTQYSTAKRETRVFSTLGVRAANEYLNRKLWRYLVYCKEFSPFWRERWPSKWDVFSWEEAQSVLQALPCMGKEELRRYGGDLRIEPHKRRRGDGFPPITRQFVNSSGGSTGVPTVVWQDTRWAAVNRATVDFAYRQAGLEPGSPTFFLWGSDREISELGSTWKKRISTHLRGLIPMPAFAMSEDRMDGFVRLINRRPDVENALCFVTALDTLTDYIARNGHSIRRLRRVITGGGTLYPELRQRVLDVFAHEVFDMYGSRDMGMMAVETPKHAGLAALQWHNFVEVLDGNLQRCRPGETGQIYVTALENYSTALIRVDMGDRAIVGIGHDIGWPWTVLKRLTGRSAEHLVAPDGSVIEPAAVIHLIGVLIRPAWLKRFQVVQRRPDDFLVKVEVWDEISEVDRERFSHRVKEAMMKLCRCDIRIELQIVGEIHTSRSGKHSYCIRAAGLSPLRASGEQHIDGRV